MDSGGFAGDKIRGIKTIEIKYSKLFCSLNPFFTASLRDIFQRCKADIKASAPEYIESATGR